MADTINSLTQIEDFFQNLTLKMLGMDPAVEASQHRVRIGWMKKGAPGWKIDEDVAFVLVNTDDDPITQQVDVGYQTADVNNADRHMSYTRVLRVTWNFYGPHSFDDADNMRAALYLPALKDLMSAFNLAYIISSNIPMRAPELFNGQWWDRTTWYARFNELVIRRSTVPYLQSADVQILKG